MSDFFGKYAYATIIIDGVGVLSEEASISLDRTTNSQPVMTVVKGYTGESPGAPMVELSVDSAVPSTGFELDPGLYMAALSLNSHGENPNGVNFTIVLSEGAVSFGFKGFIYADNFQHAVNSASKLTFRARGAFVNKWQ